MRTYAAGLIVGVQLWASLAYAQADEKVVAVFPINDATGQVRATLDTLANVLSSNVAKQKGFAIVPQAELRAKLNEKKIDSYKSCYDEACQIEIGRDVAASHAVQTKIGRLGDKCVVTANLFNLTKSLSDGTADVQAACDAASLGDAMRIVALRLAGVPEEAPTGIVTIDSTPRDAALVIDGKPIEDKTPASVELDVGEHQIEANTERLIAKKTVTVEAGKAQKLSLTLTVRPEVAAAEQRMKDAEAERKRQAMLEAEQRRLADEQSGNIWLPAAVGAASAGAVVAGIVVGSGAVSDAEAGNFDGTLGRARAGDALLITGGLALISSAVWLLLEL